MQKTIYLNLEDDVTKIVAKVKAQKADSVVLVIPKQSYVLADSINLRLLKKQLDMLGKDVSILTMDTKGQMYAEDAGFALKHLPKVAKSTGLSDVRTRKSARLPVVPMTLPNTEDVEMEVPEAPRERVAPAPRKRVVRSVPKTSARVAPSVHSAKIYKDRSVAGAMGDMSVKVRKVEPRSNDNVYIPANDTSGKAPGRRSYKKWMISFVVVALILSLVLGFIILPSATLTVHARSQTVARDLEVIVDSGVTTIDSSRLTVPATKVDETRQLTSNFTANGKKEVGSKAEGRVALYNLTGNPLTLRASTTTLTVGSKSYSFSADQPNIVPLASATSDSNASVADIVAAEGGEDFNLPAGTRMEITNQAFGSQPQRLYAKTVTQVIGGSSRFISILSQEDITRSQQDLTKNVVSQINQEFANSQALVDGAYTVDLRNFSTDKAENTETTTFAAGAIVVIKGLAFDEAALRTMIRDRLMQTLGQDKELQELEKDTIVYKIKNLDIEQGVMQLSIHYESKALPVIDQQGLLVQLAGKSRDEASDIVLTNPDIEKVEITLSPSWQGSLPRFVGKIKLNIEK